jgi:hypothetical protein
MGEVMAVNPRDYDTKDMRLMRERDEALTRAERAEAELATLRLIVTEKFARDIEVAVKPEDAADVAKWAQAPDAVRELLKHTPINVSGYEYEISCAECAADQGHHPDCAVFAAWAALDDPRAAEAIGAAFDRARPPRRPASATQLVEAQLGPMMVTSTVFNGERMTAEVNGVLYPCSLDVEPGMRAGVGHDGILVPYREEPFRLASESEQAARERTCEHWHRTETEYGFVTCNDCGAELTPRVHQQGDDGRGTRCGQGVVGSGDQLVTCPECRRLYGLRYSRVTSDARGMESVEDEALIHDIFREQWHERHGYYPTP